MGYPTGALGVETAGQDGAVELTALVRGRGRPTCPVPLVAVDFAQSTLAPLVDDPATSRPVHGAIEALADLARRGVRTAVITGRDALTAVRLGNFERAVDGLVVEGLYGAAVVAGAAS